MDVVDKSDDKSSLLSMGPIDQKIDSLSIKRKEEAITISISISSKDNTL